MKSDQERHDFARVEASRMPPDFRSRLAGKAVSTDMCFIEKKKVVYLAEKRYNTHQRTPLGEENETDLLHYTKRVSLLKK